jgi:glycosyltransferase involved in cell wall biosynthesis
VGARLQLVVPCYNEAGRLKTAAFLDAVARFDVAFVFVDDGSTDGTPAILADLRARGADAVRVVTLERNLGKGNAVRQGVLAALERRPALVGYWDADLSTPLDALQELVDVFDARPEVDIVMGARVKLLGRHIERSPVRHYAGRVFATVASLVLGVGVYDTQCGAKVFRVTDPVRRTFEEPFSSTWIFDVEILSRYLTARGPAGAAPAICEVPLATWTGVPGSKVKMRHALRVAWDLAAIALAHHAQLTTHNSKRHRR